MPAHLCLVPHVGHTPRPSACERHRHAAAHLGAVLDNIAIGLERQGIPRHPVNVIAKVASAGLAIAPHTIEQRLEEDAQ